MPQPPSNPTGNILSQPNAAVNTADKLLAQILGGIAVAIQAIATNINDNSSAAS